MHSVGSRKKKYFSKYKKRLLKLPDLLGTQKESYTEFIEKGMWELFQEYNNIKDHNKIRFELNFVSYKLGAPLQTEKEARKNSTTYGVPIKITVRLKNKTLNVNKTQEISFGTIPLMTDRGSFIINGLERIIISQITRSFGVSFSAGVVRNRKAFSAKVIPLKGVWLELESDGDGICTIRINRGGRIYITSLLRVLGLKNRWTNTRSNTR